MRQEEGGRIQDHIDLCLTGCGVEKRSEVVRDDWSLFSIPRPLP